MCREKESASRKKSIVNAKIKKRPLFLFVGEPLEFHHQYPKIRKVLVHALQLVELVKGRGIGYKLRTHNRNLNP